MASLIINISLVGFMLVIALMILSSRRLFAVIVMSGAYSLISAAMFINLDAVDVAFTEAAVGGGLYHGAVYGGDGVAPCRRKTP